MKHNIYIPNPLPTKLYQQPYQSGITDPYWPRSLPEDLELKEAEIIRYLRSQIEAGRMNPFSEEEWADLKMEMKDLAGKYDSDYGGRVDKQKYLCIMRANVTAQSRRELEQVLTMLTQWSYEEMEKHPSKKHVAVLEEIPDSYRVTITLGLGATLFVDGTGFDRYGIRARKPTFLKVMPSFAGDDEDFDPKDRSSDLIVLISSDHPYVNVAVVRFFAEYFNKRFSEKYQAGGSHDVLEWIGVEQGFARKDKREYLKFDDGIDNIRMGDALERLVYVDESDNEPPWCRNGTYLVYRKIREHMPIWEAFKPEAQSGMIGRHKGSGLPLSRERAGHDQLTPVYPDPKDARDGPLTAHIRKVQPRRPNPDLFGINDQERRFLRRPYPFFDGLEPGGQAINGLHFLAFMKSIQQQFEHVVNMWQMNPHFPMADVGVDALYGQGVLSTIDGGYYFCPPAPKNPDDFIGAGIFV